MAQIILSNTELLSRLNQMVQSGVLDTTTLTQLINNNSQLPANERLTTVGSTSSTVTNGIYKKFQSSDKIEGRTEVVTTGMWSGDVGSLSNAYTASSQVAQTAGQYYYNVYDVNPITSSAEVQYSISYGHKYGSGSVQLSSDNNATLATKAIYAQYSALLLSSGSKFQFYTSSTQTFVDSDDIYVINIGRNRYRETMDAGNWSLTLSGSNGKFTLIDNSGKKFGDTFGISSTENKFSVVSGSLNLGSQSEATVNSLTASNGKGYGLFYADQAIIVLNPSAVGNIVGDVPGSGSAALSLSGSLSNTTNQYNHERLYNSIKLGGDFQARRTENVKTSHYFVRVNNREFNYSNNPTFADSYGNFREKAFETDPKTFITTIGLYNDANELIAVAKTSQPIAKSFSTETLVRVKLSF